MRVDERAPVAGLEARCASKKVRHLGLFEQDLASGRLVQLFDLCVDAGRYWLTRLKSRSETTAMVAVKEWLQRGD